MVHGRLRIPGELDGERVDLSDSDKVTLVECANTLVSFLND